MHGFHHLRERMRITQGLEPFPARSPLVRKLDYLMYGVGLIAPLALVPQIVQIYSTKSSAGVSLLTWILLLISSTLWTIYGAVHKDKHLLFASAMVIGFQLAIIIGMLLYS